jgi:serine/threonine-protein kinase
MEGKRPEPASAATKPARFVSTLGATSEQSLWRAATVAADADPPSSIAGEGVDATVVIDRTKRYRIHDVLGVGGMGEVRLCRDEAIGRDVALKTLIEANDADVRAERRFLREVRVQGQLEHPSVVPVYDIGVGTDGRLFFTMRRVTGPTLAEVLDALERGEAAAVGGITRRRLLEDFVRVCLVIDYAHTRGVIHRDLKPQNLMLGSYGEVYVLDWGIARVLKDQPAAGALAAGASSTIRAIVGTPGYMAPEQVQGIEELHDARTDVYALGVILYEILTLSPLHQGTRDQIFDATVRGIDARPSAVASDVPPELDAVCARATLLDRAQRFATVREMAAAVERYLDGDRDVERRRELASERVAAAREADKRARNSPDVASAEAARAEAMRQVIQALALDPEEADARRMLVQLMLEVPEKLPPSVESEMAEAMTTNRVEMARFGVYGLVAWAGTIPFVAMLGVRDVSAFLTAAALTMIAAGWALFIWKKRLAAPKFLVVLAFLVACTSGALSCWLGPFILTPLAAATTTIWFTFQAARRERLILAVLGGLATLVPLGLELAGIIPRSFGFEAGRPVLYPRALQLPPLGTTLALTYTSVTFCVVQPVMLGRLRDALSRAERKLFLQAWHLRQLAPETVRGEAEGAR